MSPHSDTRGFSLIELMIALALLSIAVGIAIPNFASLIRNNQVQAQAQTLNSLLQYARSQAVVRRTTVGVTSAGNTWTVTAGVTPIRIEEFNPDHATIKSSGPINIIYASNGSASSIRLIVCRPDENPAFAYLIGILPSGSVTLHTRGRKSDNTTPLQDCSTNE